MLVLSYIFVAVPFVVAVLLALLIPVFVIWFVRSPVAGAAGIMLLFALNTLAVSFPALPIGVSVYPPDLLFSLLAAASLLRFSFERPPLGGLEKLWLWFGIILFASFAAGLVQYGTLAGVEFRGYFYFWVGTAYLAMFQLTSAQQERILEWALACAIAVCGVSVYRWEWDATVGEIALWHHVAGTTPMRVIASSGALFISHAFLAAFFFWAVGRRDRIGWQLLAPVLLLIVVLLQHRSVWAATLLPAALLFAGVASQKGGAGVRMVSFAAVAVVSAGLLIAGWGETVGSNLSAAVSEPFSQKSTIAWRIDSWQTIVKDTLGGGPLRALFGQPFGAGFARFSEVQGMETHVAAHSFYVTTLARVGAVGLLCLVLTSALLAVRLWRVPPSENAVYAPRLFAALLASQLTYFINYSPEYVEAVFAGLALVAARSGPRPIGEVAPKDMYGPRCSPAHLS